MKMLVTTETVVRVEWPEEFGPVVHGDEAIHGGVKLFELTGWTRTLSHDSEGDVRDDFVVYGRQVRKDGRRGTTKWSVVYGDVAERAAREFMADEWEGPVAS